MGRRGRNTDRSLPRAAFGTSVSNERFESESGLDPLCSARSHPPCVTPSSLLSPAAAAAAECGLGPGRAAHGTPKPAPSPRPGLGGALIRCPHSRSAAAAAGLSSSADHSQAPLRAVDGLVPAAPAGALAGSLGHGLCHPHTR